MKTRDLTSSVFVALLLASSMAGAESQYPAADFEPGVVYQDRELIEKHSQAAREKASTAQPAPKVGGTAVTGTSSAPSASTPPESVAVVESSAAKPSSQGGGLLSENFPILLIVLGLGGFIFWNSRRAASRVSQIQTSAPVTPAPASGATGVARYLKTIPDAAPETGVARYLKSQPPKAAVAETGVAKYLQSLPAAEAVVAVAASVSKGETGVARYLTSI